MKEIFVPISVGELIDKVTILRIKRRRIADAAKRANVERELAALEAVCGAEGLDASSPTARELEAVNEQLWVIEDDIREKERSQSFDAEFVRLARAVYQTNDRRFAVKAKLNADAGSAYREEKSYKDYGSVKFLLPLALVCGLGSARPADAEGLDRIKKSVALSDEYTSSGRAYLNLPFNQPIPMGVTQRKGREP